MKLGFSYKKEKEQIVEKYPNLPVMTFVGEGSYAKFALNAKACEMLGYEETTPTAKISFAKDEDNNDKMVILNSTGQVTENQSNLFASREFANKKFLTRINKEFDMEVKQGDEFLLVKPEANAGFPVMYVTNEIIEGSHTSDFSEFTDEGETEIIEPKNEVVSDFGNPNFN